MFRFAKGYYRHPLKWGLPLLFGALVFTLACDGDNPTGPVTVACDELNSHAPVPYDLNTQAVLGPYADEGSHIIADREAGVFEVTCGGKVYRVGIEGR